MPRYFFHVYNVEIQAEDREGEDLPSLDAVRQQAINGIRSILADEIRRGKMDLRGRIEVRDAKCSPVMTVPYRDALDLKLGDG